MAFWSRLIIAPISFQAMNAAHVLKWAQQHRVMRMILNERGFLRQGQDRLFDLEDTCRPKAVYMDGEVDALAKVENCGYKGSMFPL